MQDSKFEAKERMQVRFSKLTMERLNEMAGRYGMTVNSLVTFIVGQWLDNNYDLKDKMISSISSNNNMDKLFENPVFAEMFNGLMKEAVVSAIKLEKPICPTCGKDGSPHSVEPDGDVWTCRECGTKFEFAGC